VDSTPLKIEVMKQEEEDDEIDFVVPAEIIRNDSQTEEGLRKVITEALKREQGPVAILSPAEEVFRAKIENYLHGYPEWAVYFYSVFIWKKRIDFVIISCIIYGVCSWLVHMDLTLISLFLICLAVYVLSSFLYELVEIKLPWDQILPSSVTTSDVVDLAVFLRDEYRQYSSLVEEYQKENSLVVTVGIYGCLLAGAVIGHLINAYLLFLLLVVLVLCLPGLSHRYQIAKTLRQKKME